MGKIGYGYGSEWHLLRYLGYHRQLLQKTILSETGGDQIQWLDFKFSRRNIPLSQDQEWKGIEFITDSDVNNRWKNFWPQTGNPPNWDAVGQLISKNGQEWLLVEAKAHLEELYRDCSAKQKSKQMIIKAMDIAKKSYRAEEVEVKKWLSPYYQFCNRLSVLHFLIKECNPPVPARLVLIYFYGDQMLNQECPQSPEEWEPELKKMHHEVGLDKKSELLNRVHRVFLPVILVK